MIDKHPKYNYWTPLVAPSGDDNRLHGYEPGSEWLYGERIYKCLYSDLTTATWGYVATTVV